MDPFTIAGLTMGLMQTGIGIAQKNKAANIAAKNIRPVRTTPTGVTDNLALAESRASQGLSEGAKSLYSQQADRGLSASIDAITRTGVGGNAIGDLYDNYEQGISKLALAEDNAIMRNLGVYMAANKENADEDDLNWQINSYAPWADKAQQATQLSEQGMKNISGGLNAAFSAGVAGATAGTNPNAGLQTNNAMPKPKQYTAMLGTVPRDVNYTQRSLSSLNSLGLLPVNSPSLMRSDLLANNSINGANNAGIMYDMNNPYLTNNW